MGKGKYKTSLEKLTVLRVKTYSKNDGDMPKDTEASLKGFILTKPH